MTVIFVAKGVYNILTIRDVLDCLSDDKKLRRICGWERKSGIPSQSTFFRAFAESPRVNYRCLFMLH